MRHLRMVFWRNLITYVSPLQLTVQYMKNAPNAMTRRSAGLAARTTCERKKTEMKQNKRKFHQFCQICRKDRDWRFRCTSFIVSCRPWELKNHSHLFIRLLIFLYTFLRNILNFNSNIVIIVIVIDVSNYNKKWHKLIELFNSF